MPAGARPGERLGGRQKGTPNKASQDIIEKLARLSCDPIEGMALLASGKVPCGVCHGRGKTRYRIPGTDKVGERLCESCYGTLMEHISPDLRGKMYAELANYAFPKRRAIEVSGSIELTATLESRLLAGRRRLAGQPVIDVQPVVQRAIEAAEDAEEPKSEG